MLRLGSVARCIWHGDVALNISLLNKADAAGQKIYNVYMTLENGKPCLRGAAQFELDFRSAKNASLNKEAVSTLAEHKSNSILQKSKKK